MKKIFFTALAMIILTGCGSDIDLVKKGVMEFNQTTTLGKALDNWKSCEKREWDEFETSNGIKVVQFTCQHKVKKFMAKTKSLLSKEDQAKAHYLDIYSNTQTFQFTINHDNTFQINSVTTKTKWNDGKTFEDTQEPVAQLKSAYSNKDSFNTKELNKVVAEQIAYVFSIIKSQAN